MILSLLGWLASIGSKGPVRGGPVCLSWPTFARTHQTKPYRLTDPSSSLCSLRFFPSPGSWAISSSSSSACTSFSSSLSLLFDSPSLVLSFSALLNHLIIGPEAVTASRFRSPTFLPRIKPTSPASGCLLPDRPCYPRPLMRQTELSLHSSCLSPSEDPLHAEVWTKARHPEPPLSDPCSMERCRTETRPRQCHLY